jgi:hypothetical protein
MNLHWWFTPVILATQEIEIRRIVVQSHPRQIICKNLSRRNPSQKKDWCCGLRCRPWVLALVPHTHTQKKPRKIHASQVLGSYVCITTLIVTWPY